MKPRKIQILKNLLVNDERVFSDPSMRIIIEGLVSLFEWQGHMKELFPTVSQEYADYYKEYAAGCCPGFLVTFSENYMIKDQAAAVPFEASEEEELRDVYDYSLISVCAYVADLAEVYRKNKDVRKFCDDVIEAAASDEKELISWKNVLSRSWFMSDFQREQMRIKIIQGFKNDV